MAWKNIMANENIYKRKIIDHVVISRCFESMKDLNEGISQMSSNDVQVQVIVKSECISEEYTFDFFESESFKDNVDYFTVNDNR